MTTNPIRPPAGGPRVDIVVRTMADDQRAASLFRALDTIQDQRGVWARPIVMVNGDRRSPAVMARLLRRAGIVWRVMDAPDPANALVQGVRRVEAPFYMVLDDDDELLPDALHGLIPATPSADRWDVLITNRYCHSDGVIQIETADLEAQAADPMNSLLDDNWLAPGRAVFRTATVTAALIDVGQFNQEWTHIAMRLVRHGLRLQFRDVPSALCHDTEGSASKSDLCRQNEIHFWNTIGAEITMDRPLRRRIATKRANLLHSMAVRRAQGGQPWAAWHYHLQSLRPPHFFKYILYTRKLLGPSLRR
ncbi:hypothetical protein V5738_18375 [Salinisphaera sp. SPP-AMP-43]|uniref:hypothetical protein n=1 Tax=Salinisphaera sp. SPP-AMP-43 TaxID=3121288 RepID=UPI003C6E50A4